MGNHTPQIGFHERRYVRACVFRANHVLGNSSADCIQGLDATSLGRRGLFLAKYLLGRPEKLARGRFLPRRSRLAAFDVCQDILLGYSSTAPGPRNLAKVHIVLCGNAGHHGGNKSQVSPGRGYRFLCHLRFLWGTRVPIFWNGLRRVRDFLARLAELTHAAGSLLIFDEIFTGLGRTGVVFEHEREGVLPDLVCLGKALGGGLPLSACLGSGEVMDAWPESGGEALHTSTFLGHPLSCATALAFLDVLEEEKLVARSLELGERIVGRLSEGLSNLAGVRQVRGCGLLIGIELGSEDAGPAAGLGALVAEAALGRGLLVLPAGGQGEVVEIAPPAVTSDTQVDFGLDCLVDTIREVLQK